MAAAHVTDTDFDTVVLQSSIPVIVDFYAPWCGPCKMAAPVLDALADEFAGKVTILKVNVDENQVAGKYGVMSIPTVLSFAKGADGKMAEVDRAIGFGGEEKYREMIQKVLGNNI